MMNFSSDPLLSIGQQYPTANQMQMESDELARKMAQLQKQRAAINMQAQQSQTPLWDEIDKIEDGLTDGQRQYLNQNKEYVDSLQYVSKLVQDEVLRIVRPRIESTQGGQDALKKHLSLMQKMKKDVAQVEEQKSALLNEYMEKYSDMTWNEFVTMKQGKKGGKK